MKQEWKQWEGRTLSGRFPLRQFLGASDHGAVFLTEREGGSKAAIKLVPADPATAKQKLARWELAAVLTHPHLLQLYDMGHAQVEGADVLFVVMEYAEEDLSQILPQRALTPGEAQEMLGPVIDVLGYLHGEGFVHGHLKPSNILASGDQLKISSDRIGKVGERFAGSGEQDVYDPPEKALGNNSSAADVWSLGVTLTEVLTRQLPQVNGKEHGEVKLPEGLSSPFLDIARNCLWRDPEQRWSIGEISSRLGRASGKRTGKVAEARTVEAPVIPKDEPRVAKEGAPTPSLNRMWIAIALVIAAIVGGVLVARRGSQNPATPSVQQPAASGGATTPAQTPVPEAKETAPAEQSPDVPAKSAASADEIVTRVVPNIPKSARGTVTGKVKVRVRVDVDASGKVVGTRFETRGPSEYFARQAKQAAEGWKFAPAQGDGRRWDLLFEFGRGGTQVIPSRVNHGR
jgi:TonB family protein